MDRRNSKLRDHDSMMILGIPDIRVLELIDVHVELAVGSHVRISNE